MRVVIYLGGTKFWIGGRAERFDPYFYVNIDGEGPER